MKINQNLFLNLCRSHQLTGQIMERSTAIFARKIASVWNDIHGPEKEADGEIDYGECFFRKSVLKQDLINQSETE